MATSGRDSCVPRPHVDVRFTLQTDYQGLWILLTALQNMPENTIAPSFASQREGLMDIIKAEVHVAYRAERHPAT